MIDIKSLTREELNASVKDLGLPVFRASQIFRWLYRGAESFDEMTDLSSSLRAKLKDVYYITVPSVLRRQQSAEDGTVKYLWGLADGNAIESVLMSYRHGNTICVSSQVGCAMGCAFCASTIGGKIRSLEASEILDQVIFTEKESGRHISNIVMMGIGEPLDNFDNVIRFLQICNDSEGLNIGMRHISLSTCGLTERIDKLGDYNLQLTLSVSLHAPDDETRNSIMPVNRSCGVDRLLETCDHYFRKTGRRISFEYALIKDVNDTPRHAHILADKLAGTGSHVNVIRLNNVEGSALRPSSQESVKAFCDILTGKGINVTVRRRLGRDIDAACGQLRKKSLE